MNDRSAYLDETVSAYIDGEATPAEADAVERDEALAARASLLQAVRDAVAAPVPAPSDGRREQAIAAAIAAAAPDTPSSNDVEFPTDAAKDAAFPQVADTPSSNDARAGDVVAPGADGQQAPAPAATRDQTNGEGDLGAGGVVVPLHRRVSPPLALAAAVVAVALVVGAGLLASRLGGENSTEETATAAEMGAFDRPENASGTAADTGEYVEPAAEGASDESGEEEKAVAEAEGFMSDMADASGEDPSRASAGAGPADPDMVDDHDMSPEDSPMDDSPVAITSADAGNVSGSSDLDETPAPAIAEEQASDGETATVAVVDLGTVRDIGVLVDLVADSARALATGDEAMDGTLAEPGICAPAVADLVRSMAAEAPTSFTAVLAGAVPRTLDAMSARRDDGTSVVVYAIEPECQPQLLDLPD